MLIYLSQFEPIVDQKELLKTFGHCGKISRIQIRCCRGAAVNIGVPVPFERPGPSRDLQHASIEFRTREAAENALELNGYRLHGRNLVVRYQSIIYVIFYIDMILT